MRVLQLRCHPNTVHQRPCTPCSSRGSSRGRRYSVAAVAAAPHPPPQQQDQQQQHARALSVVLLLNENIKRQTNRSLLGREQLMDGVQLLDSASFACIVLAAASTSGSSSSSSGGGNGAWQDAAAAHPVVYANQAARAIIQQQQQQQVEDLLLLLSPPVQELLLQVYQHPPQLQQQQGQQQGQKQQQHTCKVLQDVSWPLNPQAPQQQQQQQQQQQVALSIPELLCVPMASPNDAPFGLALLFDSWSWSDGAVGVPGWPKVMPSDIPDAAALQAAADAVRGQADAVRELKTQQGLGNKDPSVVAAVAELQSLKQALAHAEGLQQAFADGRERALEDLMQAVQQQQQQQQQQ